MTTEEKIKILNLAEIFLLVIGVGCSSTLIWGWFTTIPWYGILGISIGGTNICMLCIMQVSSYWQSLLPPDAYEDEFDRGSNSPNKERTSFVLFSFFYISYFRHKRACRFVGYR